MTYYTDLPFSGSEDLAIQLKKMDKNDPEYTELQEEYWEARQREDEEMNGMNFSNVLLNLMK